MSEQTIEETVAILSAGIDRVLRERDDLLEALRSIVEIGKRDMTNPKYDGYFDTARAAIAKAEGR